MPITAIDSDALLMSESGAEGATASPKIVLGVDANKHMLNDEVAEFLSTRPLASPRLILVNARSDLEEIFRISAKVLLSIW